MRSSLGAHVQLLDGFDGKCAEKDLAEELNLRRDDVRCEEEGRVREVNKILRVGVLGNGCASIEQLHAHPDGAAWMQSRVYMLCTQLNPRVAQRQSPHILVEVIKLLAERRGKLRRPRIALREDVWMFDGENKQIRCETGNIQHTFGSCRQLECSPVACVAGLQLVIYNVTVSSLVRLFVC